MLGISLIILTSATTVSVMTVQPAKPKSVFSASIHQSDISSVVYKYVKKGYIVHTVTAANEYGRILIVMEKY